MNFTVLITQLKMLGWAETAKRFHRLVVELEREREINRLLRRRMLAICHTSATVDELVERIVKGENDEGDM